MESNLLLVCHAAGLTVMDQLFVLLEKLYRFDSLLCTVLTVYRFDSFSGFERGSNY